MRRTLSVIAMVAMGVWLMVAGCNCRTGQGQYDPVTRTYNTNVVADSLVVTAQNTREVALGVFDGLMTIEAHNEVALKAVNPRIHEVAEKVRRDSKKWLDELTAAIKDYQSNRASAESWTRLKGALKVVDDLLLSASQHLAEASKTAKVP